jgi:hypothetical protein
MKFILPPKLAAVRKTLARSHNRRVMLLLLALMVFVFPAFLLAQRHRDRDLVILAVGAGLFEILGMVYVARLAKRQSIALGFVCPLCGGSLYDGRDNRLGFRGECPRCKQSIIDRLNKGVDTNGLANG